MEIKNTQPQWSDCQFNCKEYKDYRDYVIDTKDIAPSEFLPNNIISLKAWIKMFAQRPST